MNVMRRHHQSLFAHVLTLRKLPLICTAILMACFVQLGVFAPTAHAADATWQNGSISYNGKAYNSAGTLAAGDSRGQVGDQIYTVDESTDTTQRIGVILFAKGTTIGGASSAEYTLYNYTTGPPVVYTPASPAKTISLTPDATSTQTTSGGTSTCSGDWMSGIGWMLCPISKAIAGMVDNTYRVIAKYFFNVTPLTSSTNNGIYKLWDIMRSIANIAFIVVFLIVIYSQVTSLGISKYGIQKALPRLVISAILVNSSYWICSIGIDLSNISGFSIQELLIGIRNSIGDPSFTMSWGDASGYILSGGTIAMVGFAASAAGDIAAAALMLLGGLIAALFSVVVAIAILAARQAIIVVFVALSPLAFVAFILPSTEKLFERWSKTFLSMLVMFPMFAFLFGGAQLAGTAIIQSANGSLILAIVGMITQVIPLALTPFLVKLSGGLLGAIANRINDPKKGLVDRAKNWTNEMAEEQKANRLAKSPNRSWYNPFKYNPAGLARAMDRSKRSRDRRVAGYGTQAEANWMKSQGGVRADEIARAAEQAKQVTQARLDENWNIKANVDPIIKDAEITLRATTDRANLAKARLDNMYDEFKTSGAINADGTIPAGVSSAAHNAYLTSEALALTSIRKQQAEQTLSSKINEQLLGDGAIKDAEGIIIDYRTTYDGARLQDYATGIGHKELVVSGEAAKSRKEYGEHVSAQRELQKHFKIDSNQFQKLAATHENVVIYDDVGNAIYEFEADNEYVKEAAIEHQFAAGSAAQKLEIIKQSGRIVDAAGNNIDGITYKHRSTVADEAVKSGITNLIPFISDMTFDIIGKGGFTGDDSVQMHAIRQIVEGRIKAGVIAGANDSALDILFKTKQLQTDDPDRFAELKQQYLMLFDDPDVRDDKEASFDASFNTNYKQMQYSAHKILNTDMLVKDTSEASQKVFKSFAVEPPAPPAP